MEVADTDQWIYTKGDIKGIGYAGINSSGGYDYNARTVRNGELASYVELKNKHANSRYESNVYGALSGNITRIGSGDTPTTAASCYVLMAGSSQTTLIGGIRGGNLKNFAGSHTEITGGTIVGNVYGGGQNNLKGSYTQISAEDYDVNITGNVWGGNSYYFELGDSYTDIHAARGRTVTVTGSVYGGGFGSSGTGSESGNGTNYYDYYKNGAAYARLHGEGDITVTENVFGSGDYVYQVGGSKVTVAPLNGGSVTVGKSIYGGTYRTNAGNSYSAHKGALVEILPEGGSTVEVDGDVVGGSFQGTDGNANDAGTSVTIRDGSGVNKAKNAVVIGGSVYGGGYANGQHNQVYGNTFVLIDTNTTVAKNIWGGIAQNAGSVTGTSHVEITGALTQTDPDSTIYGGSSAAVYTTNSSGDMNKQASWVLIDHPEVSIAGATYGGGGGVVARNSNAGSYPTYGSTSVTVNNAKRLGDVYGGGNWSCVNGGSKVYIDQVSEAIDGSVYGGGGNFGTSSANTAGYGYTKLTSEVEFKDGIITAPVSGDVFAGGKAGYVGGKATINTIHSGTVSGGIYGGGQYNYVYATSGVTIEPGASQTVNAGGIYGGGMGGTVNGTTYRADVSTVGTFAHIYGSGMVNIGSLGVTGGSSFGHIKISQSGAPYTSVVCEVTITNPNTTVEGDVTGGSYTNNSIVYGGSTKVTIQPDAAGTVTTTVKGTVNGLSSYGWTYGNSDVLLDATHNPITVAGDVFGGGNRGYYRLRGTVTVDGEKPVTIGGSVYGGNDTGLSVGVGNSSNTTPAAAYTSSVKVNNPTTVIGGDIWGPSGIIYAGGSEVEFNGASVDNIYGGGNYGGGQIYGNSYVTIHKGEISGNVYGASGKTQPVSWSTKVDLLADNGPITVGGSVYGGSENALVGNATTGTQTSSVNIPADAQKVIIKGDVAGSGGDTSTTNSGTAYNNSAGYQSHHTTVNVLSPIAEITGNIYGGSSGAGRTDGNSTVNFYGLKAGVINGGSKDGFCFKDTVVNVYASSAGPSTIGGIYGTGSGSGYVWRAAKINVTADANPINITGPVYGTYNGAIGNAPCSNHTALDIEITGDQEVTIGGGIHGSNAGQIGYNNTSYYGCADVLINVTNENTSITGGGLYAGGHTNSYTFGDVTTNFYGKKIVGDVVAGVDKGTVYGASATDRYANVVLNIPNPTVVEGSIYGAGTTGYIKPYGTCRIIFNGAEVNDIKFGTNTGRVSGWSYLYLNSQGKTDKTVVHGDVQGDGSGSSSLLYIGGNTSVQGAKGLYVETFTNKIAYVNAPMTNTKDDPINVYLGNNTINASVFEAKNLYSQSVTTKGGVYNWENGTTTGTEQRIPADFSTNVLRVTGGLTSPRFLKTSQLSATASTLKVAAEDVDCVIVAGTVNVWLDIGSYGAPNWDGTNTQLQLGATRNGTANTANGEFVDGKDSPTANVFEKVLQIPYYSGGTDKDTRVLIGLASVDADRESADGGEDGGWVFKDTDPSKVNVYYLYDGATNTWKSNKQWDILTDADVYLYPVWGAANVQVTQGDEVYPFYTLKDALSRMGGTNATTDSTETSTRTVISNLTRDTLTGDAVKLNMIEHDSAAVNSSGKIAKSGGKFLYAVDQADVDAWTMANTTGFDSITFTGTDKDVWNFTVGGNIYTGSDMVWEQGRFEFSADVSEYIATGHTMTLEETMTGITDQKLSVLAAAGGTGSLIVHKDDQLFNQIQLEQGDLTTDKKVNVYSTFTVKDLNFTADGAALVLAGNTSSVSGDINRGGYADCVISVPMDENGTVRTLTIGGVDNHTKDVPLRLDAYLQTSVFSRVPGGSVTPKGTQALLRFANAANCVGDQYVKGAGDYLATQFLRKGVTPATETDIEVYVPMVAAIVNTTDTTDTEAWKGYTDLAECIANWKLTDGCSNQIRFVEDYALTAADITALTGTMSAADLEKLTISGYHITPEDLGDTFTVSDSGSHALSYAEPAQGEAAITALTWTPQWKEVLLQSLDLSQVKALTLEEAAYDVTADKDCRFYTGENVSDMAAFRNTGDLTVQCAAQLRLVENQENFNAEGSSVELYGTLDVTTLKLGSADHKTTLSLMEADKAKATYTAVNLTTAAGAQAMTLNVPKDATVTSNLKEVTLFDNTTAQVMQTNPLKLTNYNAAADVTYGVVLLNGAELTRRANSSENGPVGEDQGDQVMILANSGDKYYGDLNPAPIDKYMRPNMMQYETMGYPKQNGDQTNIRIYNNAKTVILAKSDGTKAQLYASVVEALAELNTANADEWPATDYTIGLRQMQDLDGNDITDTYYSLSQKDLQALNDATTYLAGYTLTFGKATLPTGSPYKSVAVGQAEWRFGANATGTVNCDVIFQDYVVSGNSKNAAISVSDGKTLTWDTDSAEMTGVTMTGDGTFLLKEGRTLELKDASAKYVTLNSGATLSVGGYGASGHIGSETTTLTLHNATFNDNAALAYHVKDIITDGASTIGVRKISNTAAANQPITVYGDVSKTNGTITVQILGTLGAGVEDQPVFRFTDPDNADELLYEDPVLNANDMMLVNQQDGDLVLGYGSVLVVNDADTSKVYKYNSVKTAMAALDQKTGGSYTLSFADLRDSGKRSGYNFTTDDWAAAATKAGRLTKLTIQNPIPDGKTTAYPVNMRTAFGGVVTFGAPNVWFKDIELNFTGDTNVVPGANKKLTLDSGTTVENNNLHVTLGGQTSGTMGTISILTDLTVNAFASPANTALADNGLIEIGNGTTAVKVAVTRVASAGQVDVRGGSVLVAGNLEMNGGKVELDGGTLSQNAYSGTAAHTVGELALTSLGGTLIYKVSAKKIDPITLEAQSVTGASKTNPLKLVFQTSGTENETEEVDNEQVVLEFSTGQKRSSLSNLSYDLGEIDKIVGGVTYTAKRVIKVNADNTKQLITGVFAQPKVVMNNVNEITDATSSTKQPDFTLTDPGKFGITINGVSGAAMYISTSSASNEAWFDGEWNENLLPAGAYQSVTTVTEQEGAGWTALADTAETYDPRQIYYAHIRAEGAASIDDVLVVPLDMNPARQVEGSTLELEKLDTGYTVTITLTDPTGVNDTGYDPALGYTQSGIDRIGWYLGTGYDSTATLNDIHTLTGAEQTANAYTYQFEVDAADLNDARKPANAADKKDLYICAVDEKGNYYFKDLLLDEYILDVAVPLHFDMQLNNADKDDLKVYAPELYVVNNSFKPVKAYIQSVEQVGNPALQLVGQQDTYGTAQMALRFLALDELDEAGLPTAKWAYDLKGNTDRSKAFLLGTMEPGTDENGISHLTAESGVHYTLDARFSPEIEATGNGVSVINSAALETSEDHIKALVSGGEGAVKHCSEYSIVYRFVISELYSGQD